MKETFDRFNLSKEVMHALEEMGIENPTDIQKEALPIILQGEDVTGQAKTGTGKTLVFGIHLAENIDADMKKVQAIILAPTRELANQITDELARVAKYKSKIKIVPIFGGKSIDAQIEKIRKGAQVLVCTPGRILDHIRRGSVDLKHVRYAVIDEADRMLDMGFIDDVKDILSETNKRRQTLLFSATMPKEILELSKEYQKQPQFISVSRDEITITHIRHSFAQIEKKDRYLALYSYLKQENPHHALIFTRTKRSAAGLAEEVSAWGFKSDALHGDLSQAQRDRVLRKFTNEEIRILVATDLAARGLDISTITHVINFNLPDEELTYAHRIGRTGRAGKGGSTMSFVAPEEMGLLGSIEKCCGIKMEHIDVKYDYSKPKPRRKGGMRRPPTRNGRAREKMGKGHSHDRSRRKKKRRGKNRYTGRNR